MGSSNSKLLAKDTPSFENTSDVVKKILQDGLLELTALPTSLEGNVVYYGIEKDVTDTDIYIFYSNLCCVTLSSYLDEIDIDKFACSKGKPGYGRKLLCFSLKWLLNTLKLSDKTILKVYASPLPAATTQDDFEKLIKYYEKLGFSRGPPGDTHSMTSTVQIILQKCTQGGRRRKTRKRR